MTCLVMKLDCHFQDIKKHIFIFSKDLVHNEPLRTSEKFYELQNKQTINLLALYPSHDSGQPTLTLLKCSPPAFGTVGVSLTLCFILTAKNL